MSKGVRRRGAKGHRIKRNRKGQFPPGQSGNPDGRPRKETVIPKEVAEALAEAFAEEVEVSGKKGMERHQLYTLLTKSIARNAVKAKLNDQLATLRFLQQGGTIDAMREQAQGEEEPIITEEQKRLLEIISRTAPPVVEDEVVWRGMQKMAAYAEAMRRRHEERDEPLPDELRELLIWLNDPRGEVGREAA